VNQVAPASASTRRTCGHAVGARKVRPLSSFEARPRRLGGPECHLVGLQSGVHLKLGQTERVLREIAAFLSAPDKGD